MNWFVVAGVYLGIRALTDTTRYKTPTCTDAWLDWIGTVVAAVLLGHGLS